MSSSDETTGGSVAIAIVSVITGGIVVIVVSVLIYKCCKLRMIRKYGYGGDDDLPLRPVERRRAESVPVPPTGSSSSSYGTVDVVKDRPVRFSSSQLSEFTANYSERLGAGGFGVVYRGQIQLPAGGQGSSSTSLAVAVKVLGSNMGRRAEEQFMAEIGTIGRTSHVNLVRLYGFCFDADLKALVYEFMPNGSLDHHLFHDHDSDQNQKLGFGKLYDVAVGTAKAVRYLHDECERRIIHYDIKPGNVLLTADYTPKVADFGLARLCNRDSTHLTMTGARGTPGYAAPELWLPLPVTHRCDVYSFGMLVFEILGRRRNLELQHPAVTVSQEWYPRWVWQRFDQGKFGDVMAASGIHAKDGEKAERMCKVALWCVQYQPEARPSMSSVVRMLEGEEEIARPVNPFTYMASVHMVSSSSSGDGDGGSAAASSYSSKELRGGTRSAANNQGR